MRTAIRIEAIAAAIVALISLVPTVRAENDGATERQVWKGNPSTANYEQGNPFAPGADSSNLAPQASSENGSSTPKQGGGGSSTVSEPRSNWSFLPTLSGGATASISGVDPESGLAFAIDGYYTPYGDDMKGGGFSVLLEGAHVGGRFTLSFFSGDMESGSSEMKYCSGDVYLRQAIVENLYAYAGVGVAVIKYEYEYSYRTGFYHGHHSWYEYTKHVHASADSDPIFSGYAGLRWRFADPLYVFAEYRYDADADLEFEKEKEKTTMEGGGRFVFGGGFMF